MSTRKTIVEAFANLTWCLAWSDHVEEHGCYNLSGCKIEDHAPELPKQALPLAETALAKVEQRLARDTAFQHAAQMAKKWLKEYSEPADHAAILAECEASNLCAALLVAAKADAEKDQDSVSAEFEEPTVEAISLYDDPDYAKRFGDCLGFQLPGHGVAWSDDHAEIPLPRMSDCTAVDELRDVADNCRAFNLANIERFRCAVSWQAVQCWRTDRGWMYDGPASCGPKDVRTSGRGPSWSGLVSSAFVAALLRKLRDRRVNIQRIELTPRDK
jgi:hypothetical protein